MDNHRFIFALNRMTTLSHLPLAVASVSLDQLLSGLEISDTLGRPLKGRLCLPEYQRPYRWSSEQVAKLADDLARHRQLAPGHDYYLGSLILHQSEDGSLNIIDGQQRLTSMGILCLLAGVSPLPDLSYRAPESRQRIRSNLAELRRKNLQPQLDLNQVNVTLVVTRSEDDAYRFFETQNSGGVRLSGIDIAKAHHLRAVDEARQNDYARRWEQLGDLEPVVDCVMRGRHWQNLDWRELASKQRQVRDWRDQVVEELATATGEGGMDVGYQLAVDDFTQQEGRDQPKPWRYDLRQPLQAGPNSINYLEQFQTLLRRYCPNQLIDKAHAETWPRLYVQLVACSDASPFLRKLYDAALALYVSRFGDTRLEEAGLWLFRAVYSLRMSNEKMVRESSVQKFARDNPLLDWLAHCYTHAQVIARLRGFSYETRPENLDAPSGKKRRHVAAVSQVLQFNLATTPEQIVLHFDNELRRAIEQRCNSKEHRA
ncbi:DUF262 domain-containing protein [Paraburkholderia terrae]